MPYHGAGSRIPNVLSPLHRGTSSGLAPERNPAAGPSRSHAHDFASVAFFSSRRRVPLVLKGMEMDEGRNLRLIMEYRDGAGQWQHYSQQDVTANHARLPGLSQKTVPVGLLDPAPEGNKVPTFYERPARKPREPRPASWQRHSCSWALRAACVRDHVSTRKGPAPIGRGLFFLGTQRAMRNRSTETQG